MSKTNEQAAIENEARILEAKSSWSSELEAFAAYINDEKNTLEAKRHRFVDAHRKTVAFFDLCEQSVADSSLLGAHRNAFWVKNKAETSLNALDSVLKFNQSFNAAAAVLELPPVQPSPTAYASMQRIVKQHFPERVVALREQFAAAGLPTGGFDAPLPLDDQQLPTAASIELEGGELRRVSGLTSPDAVSILNSRAQVKRGDFTVSGAFSGSEVNKVAQTVAVASLENKEGWLKVTASELKKAPIALVVKVLGSLAAGGVMAYLADQGCSAFVKP
jgi:hypothetical protein